MFDLELSGKVALVTGGSDGLGRAAAHRLAAEGALVVICGRRAAHAQQAAKDMTAAVQASNNNGGQVVGLRADVTNAEDCDALIAEIEHRHGGIDILINNAGASAAMGLALVEDDLWLSDFNLKVMAAVRLSRLAIPMMVARGGGTIFNLASSAGIRWDMSGYGAYGAVKQATRALTRAGAAEWGRQGIRVLTIAPHAESPGLKWWIENNPEEATAFFKTIPLGRIGKLEEDIGRAVVTLCGPDMGYLTGTTIPLDGGQANFD